MLIEAAPIKGRTPAVFRLACTGLLALGAIFGAQVTGAETLRTGGTGAALGTMRVLADAYKKVEPEFSLDVVPNLGSSGGMQALDHNAVHFAVIGRALKSDELARGYIALEYGRTPFVVVTARSNVTGLTLREIADMYAGRVSKWPDGTPVRLVLRPANDGDTPLFASFSPAIKEALAAAMSREGMIVAVTDQDSASEIARIKGAVGTSSLSLMLSENRPLVAVSIEGIKPSAQALADGAYPYFKSLYIVTPGKPAAATTRFIAFIRSPEGQRILTQTGHWVPPPVGVATTR